MPLLLAGAGVAVGRTIERPVSIADVWPTLAEMVGVEVPGDLDGVSLADAARHGAEPAPRSIFADMMKAQPRVAHTGPAASPPAPLRRGQDSSAPPRPAGDGSGGAPPAPTVTLSDQDRARLRALGYDPD